MTRISKITKRIVTVCALFYLVFGLGACSDKNQENQNSLPVQETPSAPAATAPAEEVDPMTDKGVGPVTSVQVSQEIDQKLAEQGKTLFETKCAACHKMDTKYVGPALGGVTKRRSPEWIMNMMMNPVEMTQKDPIAKKLLEEHLTQMTFQDLKEDEARAILEYFRSLDAK